MVEDRTQHQIAYYDPGLGTDWRIITGSVFGNGISKNILDCYRFIFENFEAGDRIYLFGFSRGAATVRSLSAFIHLFGILPKSRPDLIKQAFKIYKGKDRKSRAAAFIQRHHTMWCKIEFIGVWDTVAVLGLPKSSMSLVADRYAKQKFHDLKLSDSIKYARHALSIDDERFTFHPELWDTIKNDDSDKMKQVWFCGVHTDVGGGYSEQDLSDITLKWMVREAKEKGLVIFERSKAYKRMSASTADVEGIMHDEQQGFVGKFFRRKQREWHPSRHGKPCVHESVLRRTKNNHNTDDPPYDPWILKNLSEGDYRIEN